MAVRTLFTMYACGVSDILGENIDQVSDGDRAARLFAKIGEITAIAREDISRAIVIIERQPTRRGLRASHIANTVVESQLIYHFSAIGHAARIMVIEPGAKCRFATDILDESYPSSYAERKKQSRRAFILLANVFNFVNCTREYRHVRADIADSCVQIFAAIFRRKIYD